jgi:hypothetical protein
MVHWSVYFEKMPLDALEDAVLFVSGMRRGRFSARLRANVRVPRFGNR